MPATVADIAAGSREAAVASWASATIAGRYPSARDGSVEPAEGFCDAIADTQALVNTRGALLGTERRRFVVEVGDVLWTDVTAAIPTATLVDAEQVANVNVLAGRIEIDLEAETTNLELFG